MMRLIRAAPARPQAERWILVSFTGWLWNKSNERENFHRKNLRAKKSAPPLCSLGSSVTLFGAKYSPAIK